MNNNIFGHFAGGYMEYLKIYSFPIPHKNFFHINFKDLTTTSFVVFENPELEKGNIGKFTCRPFFGVDEDWNIIRSNIISEKNYVSISPFFCAKIELELINKFEADKLKYKYLNTVLIDYKFPRQFVSITLTDFCPKLITRQDNRNIIQ